MERAYCGDFLFPELAPPGPTPAASSPIPSQATPRGWRCGRRLHLLMNLSGCVILFEDELYRFSSPDPALTKHLAGAVCHSLRVGRRMVHQNLVGRLRPSHLAPRRNGSDGLRRRAPKPLID